MILPEFLSFGTIDTLDLLNDLGVAVTDGSDTFEASSDPKEVYSKEWPNRPGIQYDLANPLVAKARVFRIEGWILCNSYIDYRAKYANLKAVLFSAGFRSIYVKKFDITVKAKLKSFPTFTTQKGYNFRAAADMGIEISIEFDEVIDETATGVQYVSIRNQDNEEIARVFVPGIYNVIQMSGIKDVPGGTYVLNIIDNL